MDELLEPFLLTLGDKALAAKARALAQSLDPAAAVRHLARAEGERHVSTRPAPDSMVYFTALLPMAQGVAARASLDRAACTAIGTGEAGSAPATRSWRTRSSNGSPDRQPRALCPWRSTSS